MKFKVGDRVRVIKLTDIDEPIDSRKRTLWDNDSIRHFMGAPGNLGPMIEDTGVITELYDSDYYDVSIKLDREGGPESRVGWSMVEEELELING